MKPKLLLTVLLFSLFGCSQKGDKITAGKLIVPEISDTLKGEAVFPDLSLIFPYRLLIVENNLLIVEDPYRSEKLLLSVDINDPTNVETLIHKGRGPNEFSEVNNISFHKPKNAVYIFDKNGRIISAYQVKENKIKANNESLLSKITQLDHFLDYVIPLGDQYLATGSFRDMKQLGLLNKEGAIISTFGTYRNTDVDTDIDSTLLSMILSSKNRVILNVRPNQKNFVVAGQSSDQLTFYKASEEIPLPVKEYYSFSSKLDIKTNGNGFRMLHTDETIFTYQDLYSNDEQLYALYWGLTNKERLESNKSTCTIQIFDWDGNITKVYLIPDLLYRFTIDEKNNYLYGTTMTEDGEMVIMRYKL